MDPTRVPFLVDCWTVNEVVAKVADAASTSSVKHVQLESNLFKGFKALLNELYKPLSASSHAVLLAVDLLVKKYVRVKKDFQFF
ncbi:hypothetical protein L917_01460 [Phytophthora nicotianae]|uniref:Uncharacterized protein n=1 Tax=Phytophthora nicotianae TaxID=4792 RepID=W2LX55_PHYNI|nr:hypothetical protein L917_01460 [Phytophthora nicotianae]